MCYDALSSTVNKQVSFHFPGKEELMPKARNGSFLRETLSEEVAANSQ